MTLFSINETTLYKKAANNSMRVWTIDVDGNELVITYGQLNGQIQTIREEIPKGKAGRSTHQQIASRYNSRINKQKLRGYKETLEEAVDNKSNALGLIQPMLAQTFDKVKNVNFSNAFIQYKYDGNRCLITRQNGKLIAYSRRGKIINSVDHILSTIDIPEGMTIDGELYAHNLKLQTIRSWISRNQPNSKKLRFHAYDIVLDDYYEERLECLQSIEFGDYAEVVPTVKLENIEKVSHLRDNAIADGYEGLIIRLNDYGYEPDKRSKSLIKVKKFFDNEFVVADLYLSEKGVPMAQCVTQEGILFDVVLPGSFAKKQSTLKNREEFMGKLLTIEYSGLTADKIPFQPIAKTWRI